MKTILYSVSTGYIARNLLRTGVIDNLLKSEDIKIVIVTPAYNDNAFRNEFKDYKRIYFEQMLDVDRSYDFLDKAIWKAWLLACKIPLFKCAYMVLLKIQTRKRYYNRYRSFYDKVFDKYNPCLVIGASVGVYTRGDLPVFAVAQKRGIKTLLLIHSWDNIAKRKGPFWGMPDVVGVWNKNQKDDTLKIRFYKEKNVKMVGPPHFDIYWKNDTFISREEFFGKLGLDPNKRLVTMIATCPGLVKNSYLVDILIDALKNNKFAVPVQLICRPTPSMTPEWNDEEFSKFYDNPNVVVDRQIQHRDNVGWNPDKEQLYHFANLVKHTDVQVSIVSTATVEAAILDCPAITVAFSTIQPDLFNEHITNSVFKNHFKVVLDAGTTYVAYGPGELITYINKYLLDPDIHRIERARLKNTLVYMADGKAAERITDLILSLLG